MPSLNDVRIDLAGWTLEEQTDTERHWHHAVGDVLSLHFFALPPDIPAPLDQLSELRATYRAGLRKGGGGLVEVEIVPVAGLRAVRSIFKFPQQPSGMIYVASLTLPFADCSFVLKVQCAERGVTGLRDSAVLAQLMSQEKPTTQEELRRWLEERWAQDPYDPADRSPVRRNLSEAPSYDAQFPDHPLSRARRYLAGLEHTLQVSPALLQARPFTGPARNPQAREAPPADTELLTEPRNHHYLFAHFALPQLFLADPERFLSALQPNGGAFLEHLWKTMGEKVPPEEVLDSEGMAFDVQVDDQAVLAIVRPPPARADAEALLVGCHFWKAPPLGMPASPKARYFTLELGRQLDGSPRTVFCEWTLENERRNHVNYGDGPNSVKDFVSAIQDQVLPPAMRS